MVKITKISTVKYSNKYLYVLSYGNLTKVKSFNCLDY